MKAAFEIPPERSVDLKNFMVARHEIWVARSLNRPKPWTTDSILRDYRFCNVYRELDTVTQWISNNWRSPNADHPDLWFAMAVARWVNWPETLEAIGLPLPWNPKKFLAAIEKRRSMEAKVWTGAYMIGTQGNAKDKPLFIAENVLQPLWDRRKELRPVSGQLIDSFARPIIATKNQGTFMVGQIVADTKYAGALANAPDWWDWAVSGPGSRRGLNRIVGRDLDKGWNEMLFLNTLHALQREIEAILPPWMPRLHAQDLQNCLCEFDKYERVRLGQGKPRSRYPGR